MGLRLFTAGSLMVRIFAGKEWRERWRVLAGSGSGTFLTRDEECVRLNGIVADDVTDMAIIAGCNIHEPIVRKVEAAKAMATLNVRRDR